MLLVCLLAATLGLVARGWRGIPGQEGSVGGAHVRSGELLALRPESLASLDIAALDLACAEGLPGDHPRSFLLG
jgi:hypothetical protein